MRRLAAALLAAVLLLLGVGDAFAHAGLRASTPAAGDTLRASPQRLVLRFTEPVEASSSAIDLLVSDGRTISLSPLRDPGDVTAVVAEVPGLAPGGYRVVWRTLSADGHTVDGSYVFYLAGDSTSLSPPPAEPAAGHGGEPALPVPAALLRGLGIGALALLAGLLLMMSLRAADDPRTRRLALAAAVAAPLLLAAQLVAWAMYARAGHSEATIGHVLTTTAPGHVEIVRIGLAVLALWALGLARRPELALVFAMAAVGGSAFLGHAAAIHPLWSGPAKALHVAGLAVWLGGLAALAVTAREGEAYRETALRASSLALAAVLLLFATGVVQTLALAPSLPRLATSAYGAVLGAKLAGFAALVAMGARNRYRLVPRLPSSEACAALRRSVRWELGVMLMIVLAAGVLSYVPVPRPTAETAAHTVHPTTD